jgi:hypothetical protein
MLLADHGYDADWIREFASTRGLSFAGGAISFKTATTNGRRTESASWRKIVAELIGTTSNSL